MDVVARHKGKYGVLRERGDVFTLTRKGDFSERWMVRAGTAEAKAILSEQRDSRLTPAQIAAEEAAATGRGSQRAELAAKDARIRELEDEVQRLRNQLTVEKLADEPAADAPSAPTDETAEDERSDPPGTRRRRIAA